MKKLIKPYVTVHKVSDGCYAYHFLWCGRDQTASGYAKYSWAKSAGLRHLKRLMNLNAKEVEW